MAILKKSLWLGFWLCCGLAGALGWNSLHYTSRQPPAAAATVPEWPHPKAAIAHLSEALKIPTVSHQQAGLTPHMAFDELHQLMRSSFPRVYAQLHPQRQGHSLLIYWPGSEPKLKPVLLAAHLDVVPAEAPQSWEQPPFSGKVDAKYIWGRGAIDDKGSAFALLEATEVLLAQKFQPRHSLYLAFGEDEEIGGQQGAAKLAQGLQKQGVHLESVLDEGLLLVPGSMIGLKPRVALIGIAEKGYLSLELRAKAEGGHSSMPPPETAVDLLSQALVRIHQHPLPVHFSGPSAELFRWLGPEMPGLKHLIMANLRFFQPLLLHQLSSSPATNALIRTTIAPTMLSASSKENVLAPEARAIVNLRVVPGDSPEEIVAYFHKIIHDARVEVKILNQGFNGKASKVSSTDSASFQTLSHSIRQIFPDALLAPSLVVAATDSRHYEALSDNIYRFQPFSLQESDLSRIHGKNERIAQKTYLDGIRFYQQYLDNL